jgi:hypothetical protein
MAEGERFELSQDKPAGFRDRCNTIMRTLRDLFEAGAGGVEPPSVVLETNMLPVTPCSPMHRLRPHSNVYEQRKASDSFGAVLLSGAEGGNRTHTATGTNGFTDRRNSILPPQHNRDSCEYSIVKQPRKERIRSELKAQKRPLLLVSFKLYSWRFRERESAPADSTLTARIIGELLMFHRPVATYDIDACQVHIEL